MTHPANQTTHLPADLHLVREVLVQYKPSPVPRLKESLGIVAIVVLLLGSIIFIHELGHFVAAKLIGVKVITFSLGFGKRLWHRKIGETTFCISAIPLGGCRALISDPKQDALPILSYFVPAHHIKSLNPFDQRGYAWDLCTDLNEPIRLFEFFCTIFPETSDSNPFFRLATIHCAYSVALSYHLSNLKYRFSDLLRPLHNISLLCQVLDKHPETRCCIDLYFRDERLVSNLLASFAVSTLPYTNQSR